MGRAQQPVGEARGAQTHRIRQSAVGTGRAQRGKFYQDKRYGCASSQLIPLGQDYRQADSSH